MLASERSLLLCPISHRSDETGHRINPDQKARVDSEAMARWTLTLMFLTGWRRRYDGFQVYQDGIDSGLSSDEIAEKLRHPALEGTPNAGVLNWLIERGAVMMPTEDGALLDRESEIIRQIDALNHAPRMRSDVRLRALLPLVAQEEAVINERDEVIGESVNDTLKREGILFIGLVHNVGRFIAPDIKITIPKYLYETLPEDRKDQYQFTLVN